jgi:hypothetical protein
MSDRVNFKSTKKVLEGYHELLVNGESTDVINIYKKDGTFIGLLHKPAKRDYELVVGGEFVIRRGNQLFDEKKAESEGK